MFKIDKSSVEYIDMNKDIVVIKQWLKENVGEIAVSEEEQNAGESAVSEEEKEERDRRYKPDAVDFNEPNETLRQAQNEARRLIEEAAGQAQQIKEQARQQAREEESIRITALCEKIQADNAEQMNIVLTQLKEKQIQSQRALEKMVLQLSLDIAQKIINTELEKNDTVFEELIRQAIRRINVGSECTLRLNPREYQRHFANGGKWLAEELEAPFSAVADNTVPPGGCTLETQDSVIRIGVDAQLKMIAMALNQ